jgi:hypothetical protein
MRNFKNLLHRNKKDGGSNVVSNACFGVPLEELVNRTKSDIPVVIEHVIQNLEESGMYTCDIEMFVTFVFVKFLGVGGMVF